MVFAAALFEDECFADEIAPRRPLENFTDQATATLDQAKPTFYRDLPGFSRLLLPAWGDGHIALMVGAIA